MFTTFDTDNKILELLEITDYYSLCHVNWQCHLFICQNTEYQLFQRFSLEDRQTNHIYYPQIYGLHQLQRYRLAINYYCPKLIDKFFVKHIPYYYYNRIWEEIIKTDSAKLLITLFKKHDERYLFSHSKAKWRYFIQKHNALNIKSEIIISIPNIFDPFEEIDYIYTSKLYQKLDIDILVQKINTFFSYRLITIFRKHNELYYLDIITKIILELRIKYNIYTKLIDVRDQLGDHRAKTKVTKYLNIHFPQELKILI